MFIESDNLKISSLLRKLLCIYSRSLKKILQKYFLKYYHIVTYLNYLDSIRHLRSKSAIKNNSKNLDSIYSPYKLDRSTNFLLTHRKNDSNNIAYLMTPCYIVEDNDYDNNLYNRNNELFPFSVDSYLPSNIPKYFFNSPDVNSKRYNPTTANKILGNYKYFDNNKFRKSFSLNKNNHLYKTRGKNDRKINFNDGYYNNDILYNLTDHRFSPKTTRDKKINMKNNFGNTTQEKKMLDYLIDNNFKNFMTNDLNNENQKTPSFRSKILENKKDYQKRFQFFNGNQNKRYSQNALNQKKTNGNLFKGKSSKSNNSNNLANQLVTSFPINEINDTNPLNNYTVSSCDVINTNAQGKSKDLNTSNKNKLNYNNSVNSNTVSQGVKNNTSTNYSNCQNSQLCFMKDQLKKSYNELSDNRKIPYAFKISNEVNQYFNDSLSRKNSNSSMMNLSRMTMQSLSDSKILEIANRYAMDTEDPYDNYQMTNILYNKRKNNNKKKHANKRFRY